MNDQRTATLARFLAAAQRAQAIVVRKDGLSGICETESVDMAIEGLDISFIWHFDFRTHTSIAEQTINDQVYYNNLNFDLEQAMLAMDDQGISYTTVILNQERETKMPKRNWGFEAVRDWNAFWMGFPRDYAHRAEIIDQLFDAHEKGEIDDDRLAAAIDGLRSWYAHFLATRKDNPSSLLDEDRAYGEIDAYCQAAIDRFQDLKKGE